MGVRAIDWVTHKAKVLLLTIYGPAQLDEEHDPVARANQEYEQKPPEPDPVIPPPDLGPTAEESRSEEYQPDA